MNTTKLYDLAKVYLRSNARGMEDGAVKANTHVLLCTEFLVDRFGENVRGTKCFNNLVSSVRASTLPLTDYLDEVIGFPLDKAPNYHKMVPLFVDKFRELATGYIQDNTNLLTDEETVEILNNICSRQLGLALAALESYGFTFVEGEPERFLTMTSYLGYTVKITPNRYFGCKHTKL